MNFTDIIALALRNLRQAKLRTALTVVGVVIGVAAIITMVSFGIGLQRNIITNAFARFDLFTVIQVFGPSADELLARAGGRVASEGGEAEGGGGDAGGEPEREAKSAENGAPPKAGREAEPARRRVLDDEAIAELQRIGGVKYAAPVVAFQSYVRYHGRTERHRVGGAPASAEDNPRFKKFLAGRGFTDEQAAEAVVTENFLAQFGRRRFGRGGRPAGSGPFSPGLSGSEAERRERANQVLGQELVLLTLPAADAAPASIFGIPLLGQPAAADESEPAEDGRFEQHRFRIVGVLTTEGLNLNPLGNEPLFVPLAQAKRFREANRDPVERMGEALAGDSGYPRVEVRVSDPTQVPAIQEQITKLGFNSFSLNNQVEEIRRVFLIINGALALIGGIALLVASFGIANTMIMSILERTREIGIMKAIGGSDGEIMRIFFFEASLIGLLGGAFGVLAGWGIDRVANFLVNKYMVKQATHVEFFSIPWYLWGGAILFAVLVSLLAAVYPALRAARVDPIKALRHD